MATNLPDPVKQLELYRGTSKTNVSLYKILDPGVVQFVDTNLIVNTPYRYAVRAIYQSGKQSDFAITDINY
jgi:hypothetical protein